MTIKPWTAFALYLATTWAQQSPLSNEPCSSDDPATCCSVAGVEAGQVELDDFSVQYTCGTYANPSQVKGHPATSSRECASLCAAEISCHAASWSISNSKVKCYFAKGDSYDMVKNPNWVLLESPTESKPESCPPGYIFDGEDCVLYDQDDPVEHTCPPGTVVMNGNCVPGQEGHAEEAQNCEEENLVLQQQIDQCELDKDQCATQHIQLQSDQENCIAEHEACNDQLTTCSNEVINLELAESTCQAQKDAGEAREKVLKDRIAKLEAEKSKCCDNARHATEQFTALQYTGGNGRNVNSLGQLFHLRSGYYGEFQQYKALSLTVNDCLMECAKDPKCHSIMYEATVRDDKCKLSTARNGQTPLTKSNRWQLYAYAIGKK
ncbi:hypothetical protein N7451_007704 [Penicillium sp. IBT 35674x]|nr:hypothetical protein N7451_007704 [Penicillium sp. IBT 35674x]